MRPSPLAWPLGPTGTSWPTEKLIPLMRARSTLLAQPKAYCGEGSGQSAAKAIRSRTRDWNSTAFACQPSPMGGAAELSPQLDMGSVPGAVDFSSSSGRKPPRWRSRSRRISPTRAVRLAFRAL